MDIKLIMAVITITLALVFYTIGVFSERKAHILKKQHVLIFWLGLIFGTTGTTIMSFITKDGAGGQSGMGLHGITGDLAIILMLFHALWATLVLVKKGEKKQESFHKFSIFVWLVWLVPYILGMFIGMTAA